VDHEGAAGGRSMAAGVVALSAWIDGHPANAVRDVEAQLWGRIAKIQEEAGEVVSALIGATGQNPRKGVTHGMDDVAKELLDVAVTALTAYEHVTGNRGTCQQALADHVESLVRRAGLAPLNPS